MVEWQYGVNKFAVYYSGSQVSLSAVILVQADFVDWHFISLLMTSYALLNIVYGLFFSSSMCVATVERLRVVYRVISVLKSSHKDVDQYLQ